MLHAWKLCNTIECNIVKEIIAMVKFGTNMKSCNNLSDKKRH